MYHPCEHSLHILYHVIQLRWRAQKTEINDQPRVCSCYSVSLSTSSHHHTYTQTICSSLKELHQGFSCTEELSKHTPNSIQNFSLSFPRNLEDSSIFFLKKVLSGQNVCYSHSNTICDDYIRIRVPEIECWLCPQCQLSISAPSGRPQVNTQGPGYLSPHGRLGLSS